MSLARASLLTIASATAAACGSDNVHHLADGGNDGRSIDASTIDAPLAPVTVLVTQNGAPSVGIRAYFLNADFTVVASDSTGPDGTAHEVMRAGGSVTVVEPPSAADLTPANQGIDTFLGVKPGDVLHVELGSSPATSTPITFDLTVPTDADLSAASYQLFSTCGTANLTAPPPGLRAHAHPDATNPPVSVTLASCSGVADMLIVSFDANAKPLDALYAPGTAVANGTPVTLTGAYSAILPQALTYTNVLAGVSAVSATGRLVTANGQVFGFSDSAATLGATSTVTLAPPSAIGSTEILSQLFTGSVTVTDDQTIVDWAADGSAGSGFDYTASHLADYATAPAFDATTETLGWTASGGGAADAIFASVGFSRVDAGGSGAPNDTWNWNVAAPGTAVGAVVFPTLPTDLFDFNGKATDTITVNTVETGIAPGGYDAVRADEIDLDFDAITAGVGPSGRVILDYFAAHTGVAGLRARHR